MDSSASMSLLMPVIEECGFSVLEKVDLPPLRAQLAPIPIELHPEVRRLLENRYTNGLYKHQALAISRILAGDDICLATSTASGKSLVFITAAVDRLKRDKAEKILAVYPAKALIQDQIGKWRLVLDPLGLKQGYIDGGIPVGQRAAILDESNIVLMTPDVVHAWLMSNLANSQVQRFLSSLKLMILDEAHVYEGVFGTNMAYLMRRLEAASASFQLICATATISDPTGFITNLTGRSNVVIGPSDDGSAIPAKSVLLMRETKGKSFENLVKLLRELAKGKHGRFIAFSDSRSGVEKIVAAILRSPGGDNSDDDGEAFIQDVHMSQVIAQNRVLPYRAGYETEDRNDIQKALERGALAGVVSTSALELGLDIGDIDIVLMLSTPPSMKAFWQRLGRGGRKRPGVCMLIDSRGMVIHSAGGLRAYMTRPLEPNWIYLENRFIQYANALCASQEYSSYRVNDIEKSFVTLPERFKNYLENELNPIDPVPNDLYSLKQRAQSGPQHEFPLRSATERNFNITGSMAIPLGTATHSQALREAYPGAVYYYMAIPWRVYKYGFHKGEIHCKREKRYTTQPISQAMVFPRFAGSTLCLLKSDKGFVAEAEMQVSERVLGFIETRGSAKIEHRYGPLSPYSQREMSRFFETTGVCWYFADRGLVNEAIANLVMDAFCQEFGIQARDLGVGLFHCKQSPIGTEACQGVCIFDATNGSLRLTEQLARHFSRVIDAALNLLEAQEVEGSDALLGLAHPLNDLKSLVNDLTLVEEPGVLGTLVADVDWITVVCPGESAMYTDADGTTQEVQVEAYRYSPQGLVYDLKPERHFTRWTVLATSVQPIFGTTTLLQVNLTTGESRPLDGM